MPTVKGSGQATGSTVQRKKRVALVVVSSVVLVAMMVAVAISISQPRRDESSSGSESHDPSGSVKAIESICQPTDYKETCVKSLSSAAESNTTDPKELVGIAFKVAMEHIHDVFNHSKTLQEAQKDPRTAHALQNCQELLSYSVDDLQRSLEEIKTFDLAAVHKVIEDLKVWLSASMTYQETCLDGFEKTTGDAGDLMRKAMNSSTQLTVNALAIVNGMSDIFTSLKLPFFTRRLLSEEGGLPATTDGFPNWVTDGKRRLLMTPIDQLKPNVVVAQDGTGNFKTVNEAVKTIPLNSATPYVIYIKQGVYNEIVEIARGMNNVVMIGDGPTKSKITGNLNFIDGVATFKTATVAVVGNGFVAKNMGFENSAGPEKHQAVALRVQSEASVFYNCQMDGYQDTLYVHTHRQFYRECVISGTIDYIFGNSATVFQNCIMVVRKPMANQQNIVTAQGRKDAREPTALILHNCVFKADPAYEPFKTQLPTFLGRPWKEFSRTIIMQSEITDVIHPKGWLPWAGDFGLNTCFYTEFDNRGAGASKASRVTWRGIKAIGAELAEQFTVENFLQGSTWIKDTGVPYTPGLLPVGSTTDASTVTPELAVATPPATTTPTATPASATPPTAPATPTTPASTTPPATPAATTPPAASATPTTPASTAPPATPAAATPPAASATPTSPASTTPPATPASTPPATPASTPPAPTGA